MAKIDYSIIINRPIHEVFSFISDFTNDTKWKPDVIKVWQTEGKTRVGTMVTQARRLRVLFYQLDLNADVTEYQLNKKIEVKGTIGFFPFTTTYTFEPSGLNTKITESQDINMWGIHRIFGGMMSGAMRRRADMTWNNLKKLLESGGGR